MEVIENKTEDSKILGAFISIPKCASKSILRIFKLGKNRDNHFDEKSEQYIIYENHQILSVLEKRFNLKDKYIFTFVRHPYQRIVSWFYYHKHIEPYKSLTLNEWISNGCKTHWKKQNKTDWIKDNLSPLLQYNFIKGNSKINYIGKMENFEQDCKYIIDQMNILLDQNNFSKITFTNIKVNSTSCPNKDTITEENKNLIYNMFKKDFEYFNYDK